MAWGKSVATLMAVPEAKKSVYNTYMLGAEERIQPYVLNKNMILQHKMFKYDKKIKHLKSSQNHLEIENHELYQRMSRINAEFSRMTVENGNLIQDKMR